MRILHLILNSCSNSDVCKLDVVPEVTLSSKGDVQIGIPPSNYGFLLGRLDQLFEEFGLPDGKSEQRCLIGGKDLAVKQFLFSADKYMEVIHRLDDVVNFCQNSRAWPSLTRVFITNYIVDPSGSDLIGEDLDDRQPDFDLKDLKPYYEEDDVE